jgi:uncharacterized membrane protein
MQQPFQILCNKFVEPLSRSILKKICTLPGLVIGSTCILFFASSFRHLLYQSTAWDLGIFDQAIYLISQGKPPFSSFLDTHILGDHAALIFYPLALFYKIYPTVYWLLLIQAIALSLGAIPIYRLAKQASINDRLALTLSGVYLLYPLIFNLNLFDFHPDVIALPALLWAILAARKKQLWTFIIALLIVCSCTGLLGLTVASLGFWLWLEKKRLYGAIAFLLGSTWFGIASKIIIPFFSHNPESLNRHLSRYSYLGNSYLEILQNLALKPELFGGGLFNGTNIGYLFLLLIPLLWGLRPRYLLPLVAALPALFMNLLANDPGQKDLLHQYSLPILPFLLLAVIDAAAAQKSWLQRPRWILLWALVCFFALAKVGYFIDRYLSSWDTWQATNTAIAEIKTEGGVLTSAEIAPHLTHRALLKLAVNGSENLDLAQFDYILLNYRHPGWESSPELVSILLNQLEKDPHFQKKYQQEDVILFQQIEQ